MAVAHCPLTGLSRSPVTPGSPPGSLSDARWEMQCKQPMLECQHKWCLLSLSTLTLLSTGGQSRQLVSLSSGQHCRGVQHFLHWLARQCGQPPHGDQALASTSQHLTEGSSPQWHILLQLLALCSLCGHSCFSTDQVL